MSKNKKIVVNSVKTYEGINKNGNPYMRTLIKYNDEELGYNQGFGKFASGFPEIGHEHVYKNIKEGDVLEVWFEENNGYTNFKIEANHGKYENN